MSEKAYAFTFECVAHGEDYESALTAALYYLGENADRETLEPTRWEVLDE